MEKRAVQDLLVGVGRLLLKASHVMRDIAVENLLDSLKNGYSAEKTKQAYVLVERDLEKTMSEEK